MISTAVCLISISAAMAFSEPQGNRKLVFNEDFSKKRIIDPKIWRFDDGPVYNNEAETYASGPGEFAKIEDGALVITAKRVGKKIMSTRLVSLKAWKYGYIEANLKVPQGKGTWPAFWMLGDSLRQKAPNFVPWPKCGEIDIMENVGFDPSKFHFSLHCEKFNFQKNTQRTSIADVPNYTGFHKIGCDWREDSITYYLDGKVIHTFKREENSVEAWPFSQPFYLIINLAIGGNWGGAQGIDENIFPAKYFIKSVKIWQ